jgi:hypothetical protein
MAEGSHRTSLEPTPRAARAVDRGGRSGSVLVPVVAAMLILLLAGFALTELTGAQRLGSVIALDSGKAYWIAEAGIQHAAYVEATIGSPVTFGGGTYTVTKSSNTYTSQGAFGGAKRTAVETFVAPGPLDVPASVATADNISVKEVTLDLFNISAANVEIASFSLSANVATHAVKVLKLDGDGIWVGPVSLPTGVRPMNDGDSTKRTIAAGTSDELYIEMNGEPSGTIVYTLVLYFTDSSSSTLVFSIAW